MISFVSKYELFSALILYFNKWAVMGSNYYCLFFEFDHRDHIGITVCTLCLFFEFDHRDHIGITVCTLKSTIC